MKSRARIAFLDILSDDDSLRRMLEQHVQNGVPYGKIYEQCFLPLPVEVVAINATKPLSLPLNGFDAILIGGSAHDPSEASLHPWISQLGAIIRHAYRLQIPMLGVCGGHEFIADALGGVVAENTAGREVGAIPVTLTENGRSDFLFAHLPNTFLAMQSHGHSVVLAPPDAFTLASSQMSAIQALAIGESIRTIQFHGEFSASWLRRLTAFRKQDIAPNLYRDTRATRIIFRNFLQHYLNC